MRTFYFKRWAVVAAAMFFTTFCEAQPRRALAGRAPLAWENLKPTGRLPGAARLDLTISLPLRNRAALTNLLQQIYDPGSPNYHHYLAPAQFTELFGPTEKDYVAVIRFAEGQGMTVTSRHSNRMLITVNAAVADVERAFAVTLRQYQHPQAARIFHAPDSAPSVAADLPILEIAGLDDYTLPSSTALAQSPAVRGQIPEPLAGSGSGGNYMGNDFRTAYVPGVTLAGTGQSIGLLEFNGYYSNDIAAYKSLAGRTNSVATVLADSFNGIPTASTVEESLDIELALAFAPAANILVYEGSSGSAILNRMATDNVAKQLSSSWTFGINTTSEQIFQQFALQGQSFFQSSGDHCATVGAAYAPEDNSYVTVVGGTTLTTASANGPWKSEAVWNWNNTGSGTAGSSGGSSTTYAIPVWQQGVDMTANLGSTTMRNTPDVAMTADNIFVIANNGTNYTGIGGTSCAAPLWAGFAALINQQATAAGLPTLGFANPAIYSLGRSASYALCFHDITTGNNTNASSPNQYYAVPGYDLCTGWGTPNGSNLINALVQNQAGSLILPNGDFEYGSFTNWTLTGSSTLNTVTTSTNFDLSGTYGARLRQNSSLGYLSQTLATVPGQAYLISLWLENVTNGSPSEFLVSWNNTNVFDATALGLFPWTNLQFIVKATSTNTLFKLGFRNDAGAFGLDSVGVAAFQAPPIYESVQSGIWTSPATWQVSYDGVNWTAATNAPNNTFTDTVFITNGVIVTVTNTITADHVTVYSNSVLNLNLAGVLNIANGGGIDLDVFGTLVNGGTFGSAPAASLVFEPGSKYQHNQNSGILPVAAWASNSTCEIIGWTSSTSVLTNMGLNQAFGNLTWNSPGQTADVSLGNSKLNASYGSLAIKSTGSGSVRIANNGSLTNNIFGDLLLSGGTLNLCSGTGAVVINLAGNLVLTGGTLTSTGSTAATINFVRSGTQALTNLGSLSSSGKINWVVNGGSTLDLGTNTLAGAGSFTVNASGGLVTAHPAGLNGNLLVAGAKTLSSAANYAYDGTSPQATGSLLPAVVNNITISNLATVTLGAGLTVNGTLALAYTNGSPALLVTNGLLALNSNQVWLVLSAATPLAAGNYKVIAKGAGGSVGGSIIATNLMLSGAGVASGAAAALQISGGELYLAVLPAATAANVQYLQVAGRPLKISIASLLACANFPAGDTVSLSAIGSPSANLLPLSYDESYIYVPAETSNNSFSYTLMGAPSGGTASAAAFINVVSSIGAPVSLQLGGGTVSVAFNTPAGYAYQIQRGTNLAFTGSSRFWRTNSPPGGFSVTDDFSDLGTRPAQAFYRLIYAP